MIPPNILTSSAQSRSWCFTEFQSYKTNWEENIGPERAESEKRGKLPNYNLMIHTAGLNWFRTTVNTVFPVTHLPAGYTGGLTYGTNNCGAALKELGW